MFGETEEKYFVEKGIIFLIRVLQPFRMPRETLNKRALDLIVKQCKLRTATCTRSINQVEPIMSDGAFGASKREPLNGSRQACLKINRRSARKRHGHIL